MTEYDDNNVMNSVLPEIGVFENHGAEIRCFVHTLQLAVIASIKDSSTETSTLIQLCRTVAKQLWSTVIREMLAIAGIKIKLPPKECVTRWSSMFKMVISNINYFPSTVYLISGYSQFRSLLN